MDENDQPLKVVHDVVNERWEVAITLSDKGFQQVSFVNSVATTKVFLPSYAFCIDLLSFHQELLVSFEFAYKISFTLVSIQYSVGISFVYSNFTVSVLLYL